MGREERDGNRRRRKGRGKQWEDRRGMGTEGGEKVEENNGKRGEGWEQKEEKRQRKTMGREERDGYRRRRKGKGKQWEDRRWMGTEGGEKAKENNGKIGEGWEQKEEKSPQQGDLRLSGPPSGQGADGWARTRDRRVPADLRAGFLATEPPTLQRDEKRVLR
ncbi:hypothetical protein PoB_002581700 [Plakobranchus ocellatus]|uniref:Octapeptide-repeat protein T2 n=1 Tax=Plakobranchus ocellatus TaxID=259542 RepID=A0AAV3ZX99_9GAST|nr:hypothetical protein PoB_002581700 [Plakobranchus ocellatus]